MADRAQSEVLGFVVVFGIVVLAVGLVTATGYAGLEHTREAEQVDNAAVAFDVLAANADELVRSGAPSRSVEVKLADAQLSTADPVLVRVTATSVADPNRTATFDIEPRPLVYDARTGTSIVYTSGAVLRADPGGTVMLREPSWRLSNERTVLAVVETRSSRPQYVGGSRRVHIRLVRSETPLLVAETTPYNVTIEVVSPRADAWERYLRAAHPDADCTRVDADTVRCAVTTERVHVVAVRTDVTFR